MNGITMKTYQKAAYSTAIYPLEVSVIYPAALLSEEAGEVMGKISKALRKHGGAWRGNLDIVEISKEMGDVLWALAALAEDLGTSLSTIAAMNLEKLASRQKRGVIDGAGDDR